MTRDYRLFWGDAHCNLHPHHEEIFEEAFRGATGRIDFFPVAYYPFEHEDYGRGLIVETVRNRPLFLAQWDKINELTAAYNRPGQLVTFAGYEWHGNRRRWGDHNVFFPTEGGPLLDTWELPELVAELKKYGAVAFPHHTAYQVGERGKDWSFHDPETMPLAEIYSAHGCSESDDSILPMVRNTNMGPRASGGTIVDGLLRGLKFGIIASNDSHQGYPGCWGLGLMGLYAEELTREALFEAIRARRAYGVTGDRIGLWFEVDGLFMGQAAETPGSGAVRAGWRVVGCDALDRVELVRNGRVIQAYHHFFDGRSWRGGRLKLRLEVGWGPDRADGFKCPRKRWDGALEVQGGRVVSVEPCFTMPGNEVVVQGSKARLRLTTYQRDTAVRGRPTEQGAIFELDCSRDARVLLSIDGREHAFGLQELLSGTALFVQYEGIKGIIAEQFGVQESSVENPDVYYHNAWKYRLRRAVPAAGYEAEGEFVDRDPPTGESFYYLRVFQTNGQAAWSSPVWVRR